jgi:soluble lytic murein transglycosylase
MRFCLLFLFLISTIIKAEEIEDKTLILNQINSLEKGIKRDFYINEYLKLDDTTPQAAYSSLSLIYNMNEPLFHNFAKKYKNDETLAVSQCMDASIEELIYSYADCIEIGLNIKKASNLSTYELKLVLQNLQNKYPEFSNKIKVLSSAIPFTKLITKDVDTFYDIFLNVDTDFMESYFNYKLPQKTLTRIKSDKKQYNKFIQIILLNSKLTNLRQHIKELKIEDLDDKNKFLLTLYYVERNDLNKAFELINNINIDNNFLYQEKIEFFKYFITKNISYLENITSSQKLNIYTFYANEILQKQYIQPDLEKLDSIEIIKELSNEQLALLYSIIKIKSDFLDDKISKDFELGLTQLSLKQIKEIETKFTYRNSLIKQFEAQTNLKYFIDYLKTLQKEEFNAIDIFLSIYGNKKINSLEKDLNKIVKFEYISFLTKDFDDFLVLYYLYLNNLEKENIKVESIFQKL